MRVLIQSYLTFVYLSVLCVHTTAMTGKRERENKKRKKTFDFNVCIMITSAVCVCMWRTRGKKMIFTLSKGDVKKSVRNCSLLIKKIDTLEWWRQFRHLSHRQYFFNKIYQWHEPIPFFFVSFFFWFMLIRKISKS